MTFAAPMRLTAYSETCWRRPTASFVCLVAVIILVMLSLAFYDGPKHVLEGI